MNRQSRMARSLKGLSRHRTPTDFPDSLWRFLMRYLTRFHHSRSWILVSLFVLGGVPFDSKQCRSDDSPNLEVHEWSVWLAEPQGKQINGAADYPTAMPGIVETERARRREADKPKPSPVSLMTIYGTPPDVADIDLRITAGRPISQWPRSEGKSNRLRWLDLTLSTELANREMLAYIPETHWFHQARELGGLYVQLKKGVRAERFLAYDLELQTSPNIRLDGGPDQYKFANLGKHPIHDIVLIVPGTDGIRVGWLDTIAGTPGGGGLGASAANPAENPAVQIQAGGQIIRGVNVGAVQAIAAIPGGAPVNIPANGNSQPNATAAVAQPANKESIADITLAGPFALESDDFQQKTKGEMRHRLTAAGLKDGEIDLILSLYAESFFSSDEIHLVYRLSSEAIDELTPLTVEPESTKVKRVALLLARKVDPRLREDVQKLVKELADANYATREQAEKRLKELGSLAIPDLKEALKIKDLEVVMRAERILLGQKEQLGPEQPATP